MNFGNNMINGGNANYYFPNRNTEGLFSRINFSNTVASNNPTRNYDNVAFPNAKNYFNLNGRMTASVFNNINESTLNNSLSGVTFLDPDQLRVFMRTEALLRSRAPNANYDDFTHVNQIENNGITNIINYNASNSVGYPPYDNGYVYQPWHTARYLNPHTAYFRNQVPDYYYR